MRKVVIVCVVRTVTVMWLNKYNIIRDTFRTRPKTMEIKDVLMVVSGVVNKIC